MMIEESIEDPNGASSIGEADYDIARDTTVDKMDSTLQQGTEQQDEQQDEHSQSSNADIEMHIDGDDSTHVEPEDNMISSDRPERLRAIEVILPPPSDPESYIPIPTSRTVFRVLDEFESDDETFYEIEFADGRIEEVSVESDGSRSSVIPICCVLV
jgi:hypothetical protein